MSSSPDASIPPRPLRLPLLLLAALAACALPARPALAQASTATQTIQLSVQPVMRISVSGNPGALVIDDVEPGQTVASVTDRSTTYGLVTNRNVRVTAAINSVMPAGTRLQVGLESVLGTSAGMVDLSEATRAVALVTDVRTGRESAGHITYTFSADLSQSGPFEGEARTIVFTILE